MAVIKRIMMENPKDPGCRQEQEESGRNPESSQDDALWRGQGRRSHGVDLLDKAMGKMEGGGADWKGAQTESRWTKMTPQASGAATEL